MAKIVLDFGWRFLLMIVVSFAGPLACHSQDIQAATDSSHFHGSVYRVPGEFETQAGILLGANELLDCNPDLFVALVRHLHTKVDIVLMVCNVNQAETAKTILRINRLPVDSLRIVEVKHDTMWTRDYGPIVALRENGSPVFLDASYWGDRTNDDEAPHGLAEFFGIERVEIPLRMDGGNLLFNGSGLALTTSALLHENSAAGFDQPVVRKMLKRAYGIDQLITLEPLHGEPTGHVDMFATFVARNTVVLGRYDPEIDPVNAAILDRNAAELSQVVLPDGALKVVRIPMPERTDETWRTYTNVIYANGVILVPTYPDIPEPSLHEALSIYRKHLPNWRVVSIDASEVISACGALHCVSMNLASVGQIPGISLEVSKRLDRKVTLKPRLATDSMPKKKKNIDLELRRFRSDAIQNPLTDRRYQHLENRVGETIFR